MYEGNDVCQNHEAGFLIESDGCPLIDKENRIHSGRAEGILLKDGNGVVRGNRIYGYPFSNVCSTVVLHIHIYIYILNRIYEYT